MMPSPAIILTMGSCENLVLLINIESYGDTGVGMYELDRKLEGYSRWSIYKSRDMLLALNLIERAPATHLAKKPYRVSKKGAEVLRICEESFVRLDVILKRGS